MMTMWVIYDHPKDFPHKYVARKWLIGPGEMTPTGNIMLTNDLETLRESLSVGLGRTCIARSPEDDGKIVETWV